MLKREEYFKTVRRPYPPLFCSLICEGISNQKYYEPFLREAFAMRNMLKVDEVWHYARREYDEAGEVALAEWLKPGRLSEAESTFDSLGEKLLSLAKSGAAFADFCEVYRAYMPAVILVFGAEKPVEKKIRALLSEKIENTKELEDLLHWLNVPLRDNYYKQEERELVTANNLEAHAKKYQWIHSRYGSRNVYTAAEAKERLSGMDKEKYSKEYAEQKRKVREAVEKAKTIIGKKDAVVVDIMQFIVFYRTHRTDVINQAAYWYMPTLERMAKERGLTYEEFLYCTAEEVISGQPSKAVLEERRKYHVLALFEEGGERVIRCLSDAESEPIKKLVDEEVLDVSEFKGTIANRGYAKGTVRIIMGRQDFPNVKDGDVLVTSMTTPEMVPAMRRAAAFVTDEGGITCHAAIISRELGKPCIIGTKIATKVLKVGDLVEVDAEKGTVNIIKRVA